MIQGNGDRYCRNPYFLHSICSENPNEMASNYDQGRGLKTISEFKPRKSKRGFMGSKQSESQFAGPDGYGVYQNPPKIKKKTRPFSAPRHQGMQSVGLKNKIGRSG